MISIAEIIIAHATTPRRLKEFHKALSRLKIPYEGKHRKGYAHVFPYKVELWAYKTKKEAAPAFLDFVNSNTNELSVGISWRPMQMTTNFIIRIFGFFAKLRSYIKELEYFFRRQRPRHFAHSGIKVPDMKKFKRGNPVVPGWGYSKVICQISDPVNIEGEEEL